MFLFALFYYFLISLFLYKNCIEANGNNLGKPNSSRWPLYKFLIKTNAILNNGILSVAEIKLSRQVYS